MIKLIQLFDNIKRLFNQNSIKKQYLKRKEKKILFQPVTGEKVKQKKNLLSQRPLLIYRSNEAFLCKYSYGIIQISLNPSKFDVFQPSFFLI